jgi:alkanesulfonate monooxygenase SsuD/methylene tetrahydromethanopterin reductase-like flavin-dependent oxidoreductase (luciferase family)
MQIDLFFEFAVPPGSGRDERQVYEETLAEVELADQLGFDGAWFVEHHFTPGYSHLSKPELVLAALARTTRRLRLGLGVIPLPLHHPLHVAERVATLDLLTGGRLEVGVGRGLVPAEYAAFGASTSEGRQRVDEALTLLRAGGAGGPVQAAPGPEAEPAASLRPRALQAPHPPLWSAAVSPETYDWAATAGVGVLAGPFKPWALTQVDIARYRAAWRHAHPSRVGMTVGVLCLPDARRARALAAPAFRWFYEELLRVTAPVMERLVPGYEQIHGLRHWRLLGRWGARLRVLELAGLVIVGDPAHCLAQLRRLQAAGVDRVLCAIGAGALPTDVVRESLHCLANSVLPALRSAPRSAPPRT